ncbi:amino acid permease-domain-containing protein [Mycena haematopus]|nr:amino acid permease-domain-containing protein [Mycena haematopus]
MESKTEYAPASAPREALNDEDLLAQLGYKQEFKRDFSRLELFGLSFTIIGVVQSIAAVWGWFTCCFFLVVVGLAMAELGSAAPTAGGLYYWTFKFCSPRYRRLMSWLIGYVNTAAYTAGMASVDWGIATQVMAAANIGSDGRFIATNAQVYGVFCAILVSHAFVASLATKTIARLQHVYVFLNIALFVVVIIALPVATPKRFHNSASFAFGHFENTSGWPDGYAFILSFLAPAWTVGGFDTSVHISEEARNAPHAVPFAILSATIVGSILGWSDVGKRGTLAIWTFMILTLWMTGTLIAGSRQLFAFSRDRGLPLSGLLYNINPRTKTPVHAVIFLAFLALLLGLLSFAGPLAISAVFTMSIVCQYMGFATPIVARFVGGQPFVPGPFNLGFMSAPVAFVASTYMIFMIVVFMFPAVPGPTSHSMNYTAVVVGGTLILSLGYYFFSGRYWFTGPVATIRDLDGSITEEKGSGSSET